jgi:hypothetical protein
MMSIHKVHSPTATSPPRSVFVALVLLLAGFLPVGCAPFLSVARQGPLAPFGRAAALGRPEPKVAVRPPPGAIYTNTKAPLTLAFNETPLGNKEGTATTYSIGVPFFWGGSLRVAWGDGSMDAAKFDAGIETVHFAEYTRMSVLWIFTKFTVHAYGD